MSARREVHLLLLDPSPPTSSRVREATLAQLPPLVLLRSDDASDSQARRVHHPLLRSWGVPYRERTVLLAAAEGRGFPAASSVEANAEPGQDATNTLLARLQDDLRSGRSPAGDFELAASDRSVQVHSCHGQARQVQVLRDVILRLLEDDPTLKEEDIAVLTPAIGQFAPLVEAGFGVAATATTRPGAREDEAASSSAPPRLRYRITDRSLRDSHPALAALDSLLALVSGRFSASEVLEFISLPLVRSRFELDDETLATITDWAQRANVRWGLDGAHRTPWGLPPEFSANSWSAAVDRVLMGVAVSDDAIGLGPGDVAPLGVEASDIAVAGRLAEVISRLAALGEQTKAPRPAAAWCETLSDAVGQFFEVDNAQRWQLDQLRRILAEVGDQAMVGDTPAGVELSLAELRRLLADRLHGSPPRSDFFRGGITVSSLTPLRWLPFRVICLLGLDDAGTTGSATGDGDDLVALAPLVGDHDPRSEIRQALLEAILAAGDHLVITRMGRSVRTNREVPSTTVLAELRDTIQATLSARSRGDYGTLVETAHPCQPFDEANFTPHALGTPQPFSFDPGALAGAVARRDQATEHLPFVTGPLPSSSERQNVITLSELKGFFRHPVKAFLRQRLQLRLLGEESDLSDDLPVSLEALDHWAVADRLLRARLHGHSTDEWRRRERALGALPPGVLGEAELTGIEKTVEALLVCAGELGIVASSDEQLSLEVSLSDGTRLVDTIAGSFSGSSHGPALITCSRIGPKRRLPAWLDLVALTASDPGVEWTSVVVGMPEAGAGHAAIQLAGRGETAAKRHDVALGALEVAVDCFRRGMLEPIPLFPKVSYKLHKHKAGPNDWRSHGGGGEGQDEANKLAFGDISLGELRAIPARADDPSGTSSSRAERFADYLWDAVELSSEELT